LGELFLVKRAVIKAFKSRATPMHPGIAEPNQSPLKWVVSPNLHGLMLNPMLTAIRIRPVRTSFLGRG
jgi:hypothetical protein